MVQPLKLTRSRAIPVDVEAAYRGTLALPLAVLFRRRYGAIPPIKATCDQTGGWDAAGQTRTVLLTGGGSMREELTNVDPSRSFTYTLSDLTGPLAPLASRIEGSFTFEPAGTGTRVTWSWVLHPRSALAAPMLPVFGALWRGYARQALEVLSDELLGSAGRLRD